MYIMRVHYVSIPTYVGMAEKICLGCTQVRQSSMEEVNSFTVNVNTDNVSNVTFTSSGNYEDKETPNIIATPSVLFDAANPNSSTFQTVLIHNFRYIPYFLQGINAGRNKCRVSASVTNMFWPGLKLAPGLKLGAKKEVLHCAAAKGCGSC